MVQIQKQKLYMGLYDKRDKRNYIDNRKAQYGLLCEIPWHYRG
jgi:hypothetical protein